MRRDKDRKVISVKSTLFGKTDLEEIARNFGWAGPIPVLDGFEEKEPIIIPSLTNKKRYRLTLRTTDGDKITCYAIRYEGPTSENRYSSSIMIHGRDHIAECEYEAKQLKLLNELFVPTFRYLTLREFGGIESKERPVELIMKYVSGPNGEEDLMAIRQEGRLLRGKRSRLRGILNNAVEKIIGGMLRTNAELQIKGTYTMRTGEGINGRVDLTNVIDVYDPCNPECKRFDPEISRVNFGDSGASRFYVDKKLRDLIGYLLLFNDEKIDSKNLSERVADICGKFNPIFDILLKNSFRVYSHGDENATNTMLYKFVKPNQPKEDVRAFVFDFGDVMVAPFHLGFAAYLANPTTNLKYDYVMHLTKQHLQTASRIEGDLKRTDSWKDVGFKIFKDEKEIRKEGRLDLFLMDIALLYMGLKLAGVGVRHEMTSTNRENFINSEREYDNRFIDIPGDDHGIITYRAHDNRGKHGDDGRVARAMSRFNERLERIIEGRTPYTLTDKQRTLFSDLNDTMKKHFGKKFFIYNKREDSD